MDRQSAFDLVPDPPVKQVQSTSIQAYREIAPDLGMREQRVLDWLQIQNRIGSCPTAYELFTLMHRRGAVKDLNDVRPRLTALKAKGLVEKADKRVCRVTGKTAFTWRIARER